jgi:CHAT domain-containing protein/tetratricopeptide (TPR) repeat protein
MGGFQRPATIAALLCAVLAGAPGAQSISPRESSQLSPRDRISQAAQLLEATGRAPEALKLLQPLVDDPVIGADPSLAAQVFFHVGWTYFQLNEYARALDAQQRARHAVRQAADPLLEARIVFNTGQIRKNRGEYAESAALLEDALARYRALNDEGGAGRALMVLGSIQDLTGRHRDALDSYYAADRLFGSASSFLKVRLLNEIAITHKNLGNYQEAIDLYTRALEGLSQYGDRYGQAMVLNNLGKAQELLGQADRAVASYQQALVIARDISERRGESVLLGNLGFIMLARADLTRAADYFQQQLQLTRDLGNRNEEANALSGLGDVAFARGALAEAKQYYERTAAMQRESGAQARLGSSLLALGNIAAREARWDVAAQQANDALQLAIKTESPELEWKSRLTVARAARARGRTAAALDELQASASIINDLRANVWSDAGKIGFVDGRQEVFEELAGTLLDDGRTAQALEAAEAGRARAFADLLEQRHVRAKAGGAAMMLDVRDALDAARQRRPPSRGEDNAPTPGTRGGGADLQATLARLRSQDRELASLITAESPTHTEIREIARRLNTTFVEYLVTGQQLLCWVVSPAGEVRSVVVDAPRKRLETLTTDLRTTLERSEADADTKLRDLHQLLIAPIGAWLPSSPDAVVVIVAHGPLALIPFAALENGRGTPLIERHTLAFAPSIALYRYTADKRRPSRAARSALIVADPEPPASSGMPVLPGAREEGRQITGQLGTARARLLVGSGASEAVIKREAPERGILHFATHGLISSEYPLASSLLLSAGEGEDGYLRADEIFSLSLNADLVVLSGCSTGLGRLTGDGILGLSRAFIYAGTPSVVASQWDVSDRATAFLMTRFYAEVRENRGPAAALRRAQLETRRRFPQPVLWAAFLVVGEPQ